MAPSANRFDLLRLLAALAVWAGHGTFLYALYLPVPFPGYSLGSLAVYVFFFISGYLVCQSWMREPLWRAFWLKRVARIFPGLVVAVAFSVFVLGWLVTTLPTAAYWRAPLTWLNFVNNALALATVQTLPGVFETNPFARAVTGSLWTIRYELAMYVALALLAWGVRGKRTVYPAVVAALALLWWLARRGQWDTALEASGGWFAALFRWQDFCGFGVPFFLGATFAAWRLMPKPWMGVAALVALALAWWVPSDTARQGAVWALVALGVFFAAHWRMPPGHAAGRGRVDLSYGVYIYAFPVQQAVTEWSLRAGWPLWVCLGASLALVLALAWLSWFGVERPCIRGAQRLVAKRLHG